MDEKNDIRDYLLHEIYKPDNNGNNGKNVEKINLELNNKNIIKIVNDPDFLYNYQNSIIGQNEEDNNVKLRNNNIFLETENEQLEHKNKRNINIDIVNLLMLRTKSNILNMFNPRGRYMVSYLPIDNQNRSLNSTNNGILKTTWGINYGDAGFQPGVIDVNFKIKDIIGMRLQALTIVCRSTFTQDQINRNRISILIDELITQSFVASEGNNFHFITLESISSQGPSISIKTISPYYLNKGYFYFRLPITKLDTLTISLYNPFQPLPLDPENISGVVIQGSNPAQIIFDFEHGLYQDFITITGFTTGNPVADAPIIAAMNTTFTYPSFTIINLYTITVPVNLSTTTPLPSNPIINGYRPVNMTGALEIISLRPDDEDIDG